MGTMTMSEVVREGLLQAGDTSLTARALVDLKAWLRSQYAKFPWPFLQVWETGVELDSGTQSLTFGAGEGGVSEKVIRINDPLKIYTSGWSVRSDVRVTSSHGVGDGPSTTLYNPATNRGLPAKVRATKTRTPGEWSLVFGNVADRDYLLDINYWVLPDDPDTDDVPEYENDRTLLQLVFAFGLKYKKDPQYKQELDIAAKMTVEDRGTYGQVDGTNDLLSLDSTIYR